MEECEHGFKSGREKNLCYADDTALIAEYASSSNKSQGVKNGIKLNIKKIKLMITSGTTSVRTGYQRSKWWTASAF